MNKLSHILVALAGFTVAAVASAQPALKVVVVDMAKVYDTHYKVEEANTKFNDDAQKAQKALDEMNQQIQETAKQYEELVEQAKNTVLNQAARDKAQAEAQQKLGLFQQQQQQAQANRLQMQRSLQTRAKNFRDLIMDEIMKVVNEISRSKGATLVLDKSGPSVFGVPVVLHSDPAYDITVDVVREVNKDRPPAPAGATGGAATKGAGSASSSLALPTTPPANSAAPANNAPQFNLPGISPPPAPAEPTKK